MKKWILNNRMFALLLAVALLITSFSVDWSVIGLSTAAEGETDLEVLEADGQESIQGEEGISGEDTLLEGSASNDSNNISDTTLNDAQLDNQVDNIDGNSEGFEGFFDGLFSLFSLDSPDYSNAYTLANRGAIAQYFTSSGTQSIDNAVITISADQGARISYSTSAYINPIGNNPTNGVPATMSSGSGTMTADGNTQTISLGELRYNGTKAALADGERVAIVTTFTISGSSNNSLYFYTDEGIDGGKHNSAGWISCGATMNITPGAGGTLPSVNVSGLPSQIVISPGETYELNPTISPNLHRTVTYATADGKIEITNGVVKGLSAGNTSITVFVNGTPMASPITVQVADFTVDDSRCVYDTTAQMPAISYNGQPIATAGFSATAVGQNIAAGEGQVKVTGQGINKTLKFNIQQADISVDGLGGAINSATFSIDTATHTVRSGSFTYRGVSHSMAAGDFTATAELKKVEKNATGTMADYTYAVTVHGAKNLTGDFTVNDIVMSNQSVNLLTSLYRLQLTGNSLTYSGSRKVPSYRIYDDPNPGAGKQVSVSSIPGVVGPEYYSIVDGVATKIQDTESKDPGVYEMRISSSLYGGYLSARYTIKRSFNAGLDVVLGMPDSNGNIQPVTGPLSCVYDNGNEIKPSVISVKFKDGTVVPKEAYTFTHRNNKNIGTGYVVIKPNADSVYLGTYEEEFTIVADLSKDAHIIFPEGFTADSDNGFDSGYSEIYNGPTGVSFDKTQGEIGLSFGGQEVDPDDFEVSYGNQTEVGKGEVYITTKASSGYGVQTIKATFDILPFDLENVQLETNNTNLVFDNTPKTLVQDNAGAAENSYSVIAMLNGASVGLFENTEFEVEYKDNTNANASGTAPKLIIKAKAGSNYAGSKEVEFNIDPLDLSDSSITTEPVSDASFTGDAIEPKPQILLNDQLMDKSTGYDYSYENNTIISRDGLKAKVIIKGEKNFTGQKEVEFSIKPRNLHGSNLIFTLRGTTVGTGDSIIKDIGDPSIGWISASNSVSMEYDGTGVHPAVSINDGIHVLTEDEFEVKYYNNRDVNDGSQLDTAPYASIKGIGNYEGDTVNITFKITERSITNKNVTITATPGATPDLPPTLTVKDKIPKGTLEEGVDYEIIDDGYTNHPGAGEKTATIRGINNYKDTADFKYTLGKALDHSDIYWTIADPTNTGNRFNSKSDRTEINIPYLGSASNQIESNIDLIDGSTTTSVKSNCVLEFSNPTFIIGKNTITAKPNSTTRSFYGETSASYNIVPASLSERRDLADPSENYKEGFSFTLGGVTPVSEGGREVFKIGFDPANNGGSGYNVATNFQIVYAPKRPGGSGTVISTMTLGENDYYVDRVTGNTLSDGVIDLSKTGQGTITITGKDNFADSRTFVYKVEPVVLAESMLKTSPFGKSYEYTGDEIKPDGYVLEYNGKVLEEGKDYKVTYPNDCVSPGAHKAVRFDGLGGFSGSFTVEYEIGKKAVTAEFKLLPIQPREYTGAAITDVVPQVIDGNGNQYDSKLKNYTHSFDFVIRDAEGNSPPIYPGQATITGTPKSDSPYSGTVTGSFDIVTDVSKLTMTTNATDKTFTVYPDGTLHPVPQATAKLVNGSVEITVPVEVTPVNMDVPGNTGAKIEVKASSDKAKYYRGTSEITGIILKGDLSKATSDRITDQKYSGNEITPNIPVIRYGQRILTPGIHYSTTIYSKTNNTDGGIATITVEGLGAYAGTYLDIPFNIYYDLNNITVDPNPINPIVYDGNVHQEPVAVKSNGKLLNENTDYEIAYKSPNDGDKCTDVGRVTIIISEVDGKSKGRFTMYYDIIPPVINAGDIDENFVDKADGGMGSGPFEYTSSQIRPPVVVRYNGKELIKDQDYTVVYSNNIACGNATVTIKGINNYKNSFTKTRDFTIIPRNIGELQPVITDVQYTGRPADPYITLTHPELGTLRRGEKDDPNADYYLQTDLSTFINARAENDPIEVVVVGINNFIGTSRPGYFRILPTDIGSATLEGLTAEYTGNRIAAENIINVKIGSQEIAASEYTIKWDTEPKDVGPHAFTIVPRDINTNLGGEKNGTFTITPRKFDDTHIKADLLKIDYPWDNGNAVEAQVKVVDKTLGELQENQDYTISYRNQYASGSKDDPVVTNRPTVVIRGQGNYTNDAIELYYNIGTPLNGNLGDETISTIVTTDPGSLTGSNGFIYNGQSQVPMITSVIVKRVNHTTHQEIQEELLPGKDYVIDRAGANTVDAADGITIYVRASGTGYYGVIPVTYDIKPKVVDYDYMRHELDLPVDENGDYYAEYTGNEIKPVVKIYDEEINSSTPLEQGKDYEIEQYRNNINVTLDGTDNQAYVDIAYKGNYTTNSPKYSIPFKIVDRTLDESEISVEFKGGTSRFLYSGKEITPQVIVRRTVDGATKTLIAGTDYELIYENAIDEDGTGNPIYPGAAKVVVKGKGNYTGEITKAYTIYASLKKADVVIPDQPYTGNAPKPQATVTLKADNCETYTLIQDRHYKVTTTPDPTDTGAYANRGIAHIESISIYYTDTKDVRFNVKFDEKVFRITGIGATYPYTGSEIKPAGKVVDNNGDEYTNVVWKYESDTDREACIKPGNVLVTADLTIGDKVVHMEKTYVITKIGISELTFLSLPNQIYNGAELKPAVIIYHGSKKLVEGTDYTTKYSNNKYPGTATVDIAGMGYYTGYKTQTFLIRLGAITGLSATANGATSATLRWNRIPNVTGYRVQYYNGGTLKEILVTDPTTTANITGLTAGNRYIFSVQPYITVNGSREYGNAVSAEVVTGIGTTAITVISSAANSATVQWSSVNGATGYMIYRSTARDTGYVKIANYPSTYSSYTDRSVTSKGTYYYKVRPYIRTSTEMIYADYSSPVSVTVK